MSVDVAIADRMKAHKKKVDHLTADYRLAKSTMSREIKTRKELRRLVRDTKEALEFLQEVAERVQQQAHSKIAGVVSRCLSVVFDDPYEFKIIFEQKRNKTEARISFVRAGLELTNPEDEVGLGVVDVASFALRLAALVLGRPRRRKLLVLDEPFRFVSKSKGYRDRVRELLLSLSEELDVQFIVVTHMDELRVGKIVDLSDSE